MKIRLVRLELQTRHEKELVDITPEVERVVRESGVQEGMVNVLTMHNTSGIIVNEGLPCLEMDVLAHLEHLAPDDGNYRHNRYLDSYGRLGYNTGAHLKSILGGVFAYFPIENGEMVRSHRQRVYFAEYDGPLARQYCVQIIGA